MNKVILIGRITADPNHRCCSGTTGMVAVNLGFNYLGIELDEQYAEIARLRIGSITTRRYYCGKV